MENAILVVDGLQHKIDRMQRAYGQPCERPVSEIESDSDYNSPSQDNISENASDGALDTVSD